MASTDTKWVYSFGGGDSDGDATLRNLLGGKGANLAEMATLGLPVPPGFTLTTEVCTAFNDAGRTYPDGLSAEVDEALVKLEAAAGKIFGDRHNPLLVSVRSGGRASMPGMMDTVLNLGLNDETVQGLAAKADERFAYDSYRRFIQMYSSVVLGLSHGLFEGILDEHKDNQGYESDTDMRAEDWKDIVTQYKAAVERKLGKPFPESANEQLWGAISAVFDSWMNDRAVVYRQINDIPAAWGTAVNVQAMVFGNMGETSATGVAFTRSPSTGDKEFYGEFMINAQGEDVVAGIRTPVPILKSRREELGIDPEDELSMEEAMPRVYGELRDAAAKLESHYRDMQDLEFTVEEGRLYMLQTRTGKRVAQAALKIAVDMVDEGVITPDEALMRVEPAQLEQLLFPVVDPNAPRNLIVRGLNAGPGAAVGEIVFSSAEAENLARRGKAVILVRNETSPEDVRGMHAAKAIVTARGGLTSHAAVVARGMGRPCICGASQLKINEAEGTLSALGQTFRAGDIVTVDGHSGEFLAGAVPLIEPDLSGEFDKFMAWADAKRRLNVRTNADTPDDVAQAVKFGAEGIGLCRTEHMFFDEERISHMRAMILANSEGERKAALAHLLPAQRSDFEEIFKILDGRPATIRLLDPPLHEFLPHTEAEMQSVADASGLDLAALKDSANALHESNPMLGHRGCRLGITYPEIYEMQARAIFEAALNVGEETGKTPIAEIMIPLVATGKEFTEMRALVEQAGRDVFAARGLTSPPDYQIGTMIELPRAALRAGEIAEEAEFFSFGTNDLTQTTLGISRDDAARFLGTYVQKEIYAKDPFVTIDREGVGELVRMAAERGRATRPNIKLGICGEHGGDPASIEFCHETGLDYVSCSPWRVPIARLAAAQAMLTHG